ncbi:glycoside hydrolase family 57 protein [Candidatus Peregrinibacteria bacterium]|nr:glycoside hydrolase family 57 protein [Candidatus Peregrinibacteria bacterium]
MKPRQNKKSVCFYFQVHQPYRLSKCNVFEIGAKSDYFKGPWNHENQKVFEKVAHKCYLPTNALILELLNRYPEFKVSYSFSGVFLEQCEKFGEVGKQVLDSFKKIVATGRAEVLCETYYHSLAWLFSKEEFALQIKKHLKMVYRHFRKKPSIFRNTELIYNNEIAEFIREMGFKGILAEGWDHYLDWRSPNYLYTPQKTDLHPEDRRIAKTNAIRKTVSSALPLLLKNYKLSDDIAFRFSNRGWNQWPMTADKFASWTDAADGNTVNLFMDYETFGEHQWEDTGIFEFMRHLPNELLKRNIVFRTPSETVKALKPVGVLDVPYLMSWADMERDLSAWCSNEMQEAALKRIFDLERRVKDLLPYLPKTKQEELLSVWRKMQTSDHFYYMCTKYWNDGDVHAYFSPYESPYDAFITYMNTLSDFEHKLSLTPVHA